MPRDMTSESGPEMAPMLTCPACEVESQIDDYYDVEEDSEQDCPKCGVALVCTSTETILYWNWKVKP